MEQADASLQLILPTEKRNPCFTLYLTEHRRFLDVYCGLERLEVVPAAADHPSHRMLVARLYNADGKVAVLAELFDLDHKTIRAWGLALDSGDPEALQRMLFGAPRKLTPAIREFIAFHWMAPGRAQRRPMSRKSLIPAGFPSLRKMAMNHPFPIGLRASSIPGPGSPNRGKRCFATTLES